MILFNNNLLNEKNKLFLIYLILEYKFLNILCLIQHGERINKIIFFIGQNIKSSID